MKPLKNFMPIIIVMLAISLVSAQEKTEVRDVTGFSGIKVSESIQVELTLGDKEYVEVTADEDIIDQVLTEVNGDVLKIHIKENHWGGWNHRVQVKVTAVNINSLSASSSSSLVAKNAVNSEKIDLSVSSSAHLTATVNATDVSCKASSSGDMEVAGTTTNLEVSASSSGGIDAEGLKAKKVDARVSSSAKIIVYAEEEINADASSSGRIKYGGSPKMVDVDQSSSGSVHKIN